VSLTNFIQDLLSMVHTHITVNIVVLETLTLTDFIGGGSGGGDTTAATATTMTTFMLALYARNFQYA
jgi:hypothetical protein